jgi:hypothetical protein
MIWLCVVTSMIELFILDLIMFMIYLCQNLIMQLSNYFIQHWGGAEARGYATAPCRTCCRVDSAASLELAATASLLRQISASSTHGSVIREHHLW